MLNQEAQIHSLQSVQEMHVSYESAHKIKSAIHHLRLSEDQSWLDAKDWLGNAIKHSLPQEQIKTITSFSRDDAKSALIIRGFPVDHDLCATPYKGYLSPSKTPLVSGIHIGIYQLAGIEPISYQSENNGFLFRHVVPVQHAQNEKSSHGSIHTFGHHVDNPDLPLVCEDMIERSGCPEFLSLMALRSDLRVNSNFILVDELLANVSSGVISELSKPNFLINRPDSFAQAKGSRLPILATGDNGVVYCRYDKENTTPLTESAAAALVMLEAQLANESLKRHLVYQPGDLLIIKNQRVVHSREGFYPRQDGADRWLVRLFGMSSLDQIVPHGNSKHIGKD
ncbi:TauD/TfdA family dioxygenase [Vibrio coralliilyticus]|jgi:hypothetical protein|uniref:TauD/TfdA family dioxygenase n=1 Tax=Vibrio coralliilyticus TaxID=190893 RepID=UPI000BAAB9FB|nr:TauD/TfdA family dioxygenase [Vibrio coralliilyticus]NOI58925.1 hypothetical protein [Vibrio coralliilyticus]PAT66703.1 hypothetical protein CKA27_17775 [Vibrio coralliilyticus]